MKRLTVLLAAMLLAFSSCAAAQMRTTFYDVGKADAILVTTPEGYRILIDAATNKEGKKLAERLKKEGVERIDAMIITHFDKDHVGGADQILENFEVGTVYMPVYDKESKQHTQFLEALKEYPPEKVEAMNIRSEILFEMPDGVGVRIGTAHETYYGEDEENDFSLAVRMTYGNTKFLFAGDAENARQLELLSEGNVACDVLKVPHHGRFEKSSPAFLAEAAPKIAFISDDEDEPAEQAVVQLLRDMGTLVHCAKDGGDLTVLSDGKNVFVE